MEWPLQLRYMLTGDDLHVFVDKAPCGAEADSFQDAESVRTILHELLVLEQERPNLFKHVPYMVREKGGNDKRRLARMLEVDLPEHNTVQLLEDNAATWLDDPEQFWNRPCLPDTSMLPPGAQIAGCFLRARRFDA